VSGEDFSGAGELEISIAGGAFGATAGTIVEIGTSGYYYYVATAGEASVGPWIAIKLDIVCQEFTFREDLHAVAAGITPGETDPTLLRIGPLRFVDQDGNELTEPDIGSVINLTSINGAAWTAAAGTLEFIENGYLYYVADPTEVASPGGWLAVAIGFICVETVLREDVVEGSTKDEVAPTIEIVSPTPGVAPGEPGGFPASRRAAQRTPIVLRVTDVDPGVGYLEVAVRFYGSAADLEADVRGVEETVYRKGQFRGKHVGGSYVEVIDDGIELHVFRDGGWSGRFIKFTVDPLDADGNLTEV
jgi:hypothetical protein